MGEGGERKLGPMVSLALCLRLTYSVSRPGIDPNPVQPPVPRVLTQWPILSMDKGTHIRYKDNHANSQRWFFGNSKNDRPASGSQAGSQTLPLRAAQPIGTRFSFLDAQNPGGRVLRTYANSPAISKEKRSHLRNRHS